MHEKHDSACDMMHWFISDKWTTTGTAAAYFSGKSVKGDRAIRRPAHNNNGLHGLCAWLILRSSPVTGTTLSAAGWYRPEVGSRHIIETAAAGDQRLDLLAVRNVQTGNFRYMDGLRQEFPASKK